jgi:septum formation protein
MTSLQGDIILASASHSRRRLLEAAGVTFCTVPAGVDETAIKRDHARLGAGFDDLAAQLARQKALAVAGQHPGSLVIGADQVLVFNDQAFDKPVSIESARQQLLALRGKTHCLETAVACAKDQDILWSHAATARLSMRDFSPEYLTGYLATEGSSVTETVGGYKIESHGIQLFSDIDGDYFTILGLPLLPLLEFLRAQGAITR